MITANTEKMEYVWKASKHGSMHLDETCAQKATLGTSWPRCRNVTPE